LFHSGGQGLAALFRSCLQGLLLGRCECASRSRRGRCWWRRALEGARWNGRFHGGG
jgi:hypothetical protein